MMNISSYINMIRILINLYLYNTYNKRTNFIFAVCMNINYDSYISDILFY